MAKTSTRYTGLPAALGNRGVRRSDGVIIPADPTNVDWQAYQAWLAGGNTLVEPDAPEPIARAPLVPHDASTAP